MNEETITGTGPPTAGTAITAVSSAPEIKPLKIKSLTLCDFRAFAGPEHVRIELNGKNLLVYGENGAGKSSIFHALNEFFSTAIRYPAGRKERLKALKNIFSGKPDTDVFVEIELDDGEPAAKWTVDRHPVDTYPDKSDPRIVNGAYRKAILDYRSLLDTNYRHYDDDVNLFDVCVNVLLRDYPATHNGKAERIFDLWQSLNLLPWKKPLRDADKVEIAALASSLNGALDEAIKSLLPIANEFLTALGWGELKLNSLELAGVNFRWARKVVDRRLNGREVTPVLEFLGHEPHKPHHFLNEARLSALALAIYFAGRALCAQTLQADTPRLMVLDDVLIGLDQSNRLPVLQVLEKHFSGWQIVLLTYDRVWFEMARMHLDISEKWQCLELFEERETNGGSRPVLRPQGIDAVTANIAKARKFHGDHEYSAAAVHARVAFELVLKKLCDKKAIPVRFHLEPRQLTTDELLTAVESWLKDTSRTAIKPLIDPAITSIRMWRKVVLNPFSHSTPVNLTAAEVIGAIDAVEKLKLDFDTHIPKK